MEIAIVNAVEIMSFEAARAGKTDTHIYFNIDGQGPFEVVVPQEEATEDRIKAAVNEYAGRWKQITGMKWKVD